MSKIDTDNFLMNSFSKEYKLVEDQVCKEINLIDSCSCTEDLSSSLFAEREQEAMEKKKGGKVNYINTVVTKHQ